MAELTRACVTSKQNTDTTERAATTQHNTNDCHQRKTIIMMFFYHCDLARLKQTLTNSTTSPIDLQSATEPERNILH